MSTKRNGATARRSRKKRSFTPLDLAGLILAMTLAILLSLFIQSEVSYDQYLEESDPDQLEIDATPVVTSILNLS